MAVRLRTGQRNNLVQFYTPAPTTGPLQSEQMGWAPAGQEWGGFLPSYLTLSAYGAGEVPSGTREIQFRAPSMVAERQGLEVVRGPEAGTRWRVVSVDRSDRTTARARVEPFTGVFVE